MQISNLSPDSRYDCMEIIVFYFIHLVLVQKDMKDNIKKNHITGIFCSMGTYGTLSKAARARRAGGAPAFPGFRNINNFKILRF